MFQSLTHNFTPLEANNFQPDLKLQNLLLLHHKRGYDLPLDNSAAINYLTVVKVKKILMLEDF